MLATVAVAAALVTGCRLDLAAVAEVERDGTGTVALTIRLDDALLTELDGLAIDPTVEVTALAPELEAWDLDRTVDEDAAITLTLSRRVAEPAEVGAAFRALTAGLSSDDPALLVDLDLDVDEDGRSSLDGAEVDGEPLGPDAAELAALTADAVRPQLTVTLPGPIEETDADRVDGRTLSWAVPIGETRAIRASAGAPGIHEQPWLWATVVGVIVVLVGLAWWRVRRR